MENKDKSSKRSIYAITKCGTKVFLSSILMTDLEVLHFLVGFEGGGLKIVGNSVVDEGEILGYKVE